jgi:hypothetical protein
MEQLPGKRQTQGPKQLRHRGVVAAPSPSHSLSGWSSSPRLVLHQIPQSRHITQTAGIAGFGRHNADVVERCFDISDVTRRSVSPWGGCGAMHAPDSAMPARPKSCQPTDSRSSGTARRAPRPGAVGRSPRGVPLFHTMRTDAVADHQYVADNRQTPLLATPALHLH